MALVVFADRIVLPGGILSDLPSRLKLDRDTGRIVSIDFLDTTVPASDLAAAEAASAAAAYKQTEVLHCNLATPGFVDIHTHGLGGASELIENWLHPRHTLSRLPARGTTSTLATVVPTDVDLCSRIAQSVRDLVGRPGYGAVLAGIHAEGPCVSSLGALPDGQTDPSLSDFDHLLRVMGENLRIMTIAPSTEARTGFARLRLVVAAGVRAAMGHDRTATEHEVLGALRACAEAGRPGVSDRAHVTHVFNVCSFRHRDASLTNFALLRDLPRGPPRYKDLRTPTVEVIADLAHVGEATLHLLLQSRAPSDVAIITDNVMDASEGRVSYCGREIEPSADGSHAVVCGTTTLAGSCASQLNMFHNLVDTMGVDVARAVQMLAETPARIANLPRTGVLERGAYADVLLFVRPIVKNGEVQERAGEEPQRGEGGVEGGGSSDRRERIMLDKTIVRGRVVYDAAKE